LGVVAEEGGDKVGDSEEKVVDSLNRMRALAMVVEPDLKLPPLIAEKEVEMIKASVKKVMGQDNTWLNPTHTFNLDREAYQLLVGTEYSPLTSEKEPHDKFYLILDPTHVSDYEEDLICPIIKVKREKDYVRMDCFAFTCKGGKYQPQFVTCYKKEGETFKDVEKTHTQAVDIDTWERLSSDAQDLHMTTQTTMCRIVGNFLNLLASKEVELVEHMVTPEMECEAMQRGRPLPKPYTDLRLGGRLRVYIDDAKRHQGGRLSHAFWVRGFWRRLTSEHWVYKRGLIIWVHPHIRGIGEASPKEYHVRSGVGV
jgi:hypothetical protein